MTFTIHNSKIAPSPIPLEVKTAKRSTDSRPDEKLSKLFHSLPKDELRLLNSAILSIDPDDAKMLADRMNRGKNVALDIAHTRTTMIVAFKALDLKLIHFNQLISFHIIDAAIRDLITHFRIPLSYSKEHDTSSDVIFFERESHMVKQLLSEVTSLKYNSRFEGKFPLKQYFNFSVQEWYSFCMKMVDLPLSEKKFYLISTPVSCSCSRFLLRLQAITTFFKPVSNGDELKTVVPSYSIFQAALDVKAEAKNRTSVTITPIYGLSDEVSYLRDKKNSIIHTCLYFPESDPKKHYNYNNPRFNFSFDNFDHEGVFSALLHDIYHALRELEMTEKHRKATWRFVEVLLEYLEKVKDAQAKLILDQLVDGELFFSYPPKENSEDAFMRSNCGDQKFGELFHSFNPPDVLSDKIKKMLIKEMVINKDLWRKDFDLGREDLFTDEAILYDKIMRRCFPDEESKTPERQKVGKKIAPTPLQVKSPHRSKKKKRVLSPHKGCVIS